METNLHFETFRLEQNHFSIWGKLVPKKSSKKELTTPEIIQNCKGLLLRNNTIKSLLFSTDMALIENNDADAILAVYPFSPSPKIMKTLVDFSEKPVICGVGGAKTKGKKSLEMALYAEQAGASGVIVNIPFEHQDVEAIKHRVSIPIISSLGSMDLEFIKDRINSGVDVFHITGGKNTSKILKSFISKFPNFPIMATGGNSISNLKDSIDSGAHAIVLSPPSTKDLFRMAMERYRQGVKQFF